MSEDNIGKMEEVAKKRREKLLALKKRKNENDNPNLPMDEGPNTLPKPQFKLRSYFTDNEKFDNQVEPAKPSDITKHVADQLEHQESVPTIAHEVDLFKLAPRKPDWDLKRDIKNRLDALDRRTSRAIADIVREKLIETAKDDISSITLPEMNKQSNYESD